jgi:hypothetical protein
VRFVLRGTVPGGCARPCSCSGRHVRCRISSWSSARTWCWGGTPSRWIRQASILGCAYSTSTDAQLRRYLQHEQRRRSSGGMGQCEQRAGEKLRAKRKAPRVRRTKGQRRGLTTPGDDYRESIDHPMRAAVLELPPLPQLEPTSLVGQVHRDAWCIKTAGLLEEFITSCCDFDSWSAANVRNVLVPVRIPANWDGVSNVRFLTWASRTRPTS